MRGFSITADRDAVDAYLLTKADGLERILRDTGIAPEMVAAIGDGVNDLPLLTHDGLGFVGAPANACEDVRLAVEAASGWIGEHAGLPAFFQFYAECKRRRVRLIVSGMDGVLVHGDDDAAWRPKLQRLFRAMGGGNPCVCVLTRSGIERNLDFVDQYGIYESLRLHPRRSELPPVVYAENGAFSLRAGSGGFEPAAFDAGILPLIEAFRKAAIPVVEREMQGFGIRWGGRSDDLYLGGVFMPRKRTMVTFNIPVLDKDGRAFADSENGAGFRERLVDGLSQVADDFGLLVA